MALSSIRKAHAWPHPAGGAVRRNEPNAAKKANISIRRFRRMRAPREEKNAFFPLTGKCDRYIAHFNQ
jgi:hypothetical protein